MIVAIGVCLVIVFSLRIRRPFSALGPEKLTVIQSLSADVHAARELSVRRLPLPSQQKDPAATTRPIRARGAWDFTGPEFHESSRQAFSATLDNEELVAVETAWNSGDYAKATALVMTWPELSDRREILRPLLSDWAEANPVAAAEFAQAISAGVERREMLEIVIRVWLTRDMAAAGAWLNALPPHADQDGALAAIATCAVLSEQRPDIALSWAESIGAPTLRWEAAATVADTWAHRDPMAMTRYIEEFSTLTMNERTRLLAYVRQSTAPVE